MSVWFITGASRGFGLEITRQALGRGDHVAATARHPRAITKAIPDAGNALLTLPLDVTSAGQAAAAVSATVARFGRIDSLINNAGRGLLGAVEEVSDAEARAVFDVNVFGMLTVTRAVLPVMREQGAGKIINISSSGGFRTNFLDDTSLVTAVAQKLARTARDQARWREISISTSYAPDAHIGSQRKQR